MRRNMVTAGFGGISVVVGAAAGWREAVCHIESEPLVGWIRELREKRIQTF